MILARCLALAATTLAGARLSANNPMQNIPSRTPRNNTSQTCSSLASDCAFSDTLVHPDHILLPLLLPCFPLVVAHMPTILLSSRSKIKDIQGAAARSLVLWLALAASVWAFREGHGTLAYGISIHWAMLMLCLPARPSVGIGDGMEVACRWLCLLALFAYAAHSGPPMPVLDAPGLSRCCGSAAHFAGWISVDLLSPVVLFFLNRILIGGLH